ncbi:AtpZ/AtpI family protein [Campylobacter corcagiensis]|uniref:AtpZ/AtpI family protein n=1 Tax=Campylobacter corcagiensis TaxID=1448857 RepID=A0A7M1LE99_9BACT|nr:AtpZ/AtpI family protein [Campylobacter corcagiensis]QKF64942.1 ATPase_gene1 domain-containing protein [Campylobacter corcagiensis]QOQ86899.1 AtpZ/AtpI family protein [Campylobacter corcagiensis]
MKRPSINSIIRGADALSLGISLVVAVVLGFVVGYYLSKWTGIKALLWVGLGFGFAAAIANVYKFYKFQQRELHELEDDPKYAEYAKTIKKQEEDRLAMKKKMDPNYSKDDEKYGLDEWDKEDMKWEK